MKSTSLIKLLRALDKNEFRHFHRFLQSPFFNTNPMIVRLYESIKPFHPIFDSPKLNKQNIYTELFPGQAYIDTRMRNLISDLKLLTEEYLTQLELKRDIFEKKKTLNKAYGRRNLFSFFEKTTSNLLKELSKLPYKDIHVYNEEMWLRHNYYFHPLTDKYNTLPFEIQSVMENMDRFFVLGKLQFGSEIKNRERIFSKKYPLQMLEESIGMGDHLSSENPVFLIYKNILGLYDPENNEHAYKEGKKLLTEYFHKISRQDQIAVLLYLRNYIIRKINSGFSSYYKDILELYKLGLKLDVVIDNEKISEADFTNIIHAGCMVKEFEWTENFIKTYKNYLDKIVREDGTTLGLGVLYFHAKEYDKSLDILGQHHFSQILYQIQAKTFLVRIWFEQFLLDDDYYDLLIAKLEAFEKFIGRNFNLSITKKEENLNFVLATKKLANLIYQKKNTAEIKDKIKHFLTGEKRLISKNWFEEKINNL